MKAIRFTSHALDKLSIVRGWGFIIDETVIIEAIRHPRETYLGYPDRFIAQVILDENHVLRVVYEEDTEITVITLYPGRRHRYED